MCLTANTLQFLYIKKLVKTVFLPLKQASTTLKDCTLCNKDAIDWAGAICALIIQPPKINVCTCNIAMIKRSIY